MLGGCPESHYCPLGTTDPIACPAGTYNDLTHQKICKMCEPGYYCLANSTTYLSTPCPKGTLLANTEQGHVQSTVMKEICTVTCIYKIVLCV